MRWFSGIILGKFGVRRLHTREVGNGAGNFVFLDFIATAEF